MAQYSVSRSQHLAAGGRNDIHEVMMLSTKHGSLVDSDNPLPVSIGGESVTITGDVTIPGTINVTSTAADPVHLLNVFSGRTVDCK